jgi:hypothetical protein
MNMVKKAKKAKVLGMAFLAFLTIKAALRNLMRPEELWLFIWRSLYEH